MVDEAVPTPVVVPAGLPVTALQFVRKSGRKNGT